METLLIVDDEPRQVKALSAIIGKKWPRFRILEAADAEEAWSLLQREKVDAVLTDIRMPGSDGLSLAERIANEKPAVKTILISGYGRFEYARQALEHRVVDYLVKPIGLADIERIVAKLQNLFDRERRLHQSETLYREHLWRAWLGGTISRELRDELFKPYPAGVPGIAMVLEFAAPSSEIEADPDSSASERMSAKWSESLAALGRSECFADPARSRIYSFAWLDQASAARLAPWTRTVRKIYERLAEGEERRIYLGICRLQPSLTDAASDALAEALLAVRHRFYAENEPILLRSEVGPFADAARTGTKEAAEAIALAVRNGDRAGARKRMDAFFSFRESPPYPEPDVAKEETVLLYRGVVEALRSGLLAEIDLPSLAAAKRSFEASQSCLELRSRFGRLLDALFEQAEAARRDKNGQLILQCQNYLRERYMEDLSLESLAQMYHFNPSYFSSLFKQKTGVNFSDYVLELRIRNAKRMLEDTDDRIADISERVGFRNATYFNKMFKRYTGMSPNAFRRMNGRGAMG